MGIKSTLGKSVSKALEVFRSKDLTAVTPPDTGAALNNQIDSKHIRMQPLTSYNITGGTITEPGNGYRYAYFTAPGGEFEVFGAPGDSVMVDILVVAGGGGGGNYYGSGGGAGGVAIASSISIGNGSYTIGVGTGGMGGAPTGGYEGGSTAQPSYFGAPGSAVWPGQPDYILAKGGGQGTNGYTTAGNTGGCGGGSSGGDPPPAQGQATQPGTNPSPQVNDYGQPGGFAEPTGAYAPAGGGGAGAAGGPAPMNNKGGGAGGDGEPMAAFPYPLSFPGPVATPLESVPGSPTNNHYAGGGGGGVYHAPAGPFPVGYGNGGGGGGGNANGVGAAPNPNPGTGPGSPGVDLLGGGGGGSKSNNSATSPNPQITQGMGGDGVVIVKYPATNLQPI